MRKKIEPEPQRGGLYLIPLFDSLNNPKPISHLVFLQIPTNSHQWHRDCPLRQKLFYQITLLMNIKSISILGLAFLATFLFSCEGTQKESDQVETIEAEFENERKELKSELEDLQSEIDQKIEELKAKKEEATEEMKAELEQAEKELKDEKSEVEKALKDVEKATENTWKDVKSAAKKTSKDIEKEWNDLKSNVEDLFKKN
ncbi:hypothetical protein DDT91_10600 [Algoriphagus sp. AK58]|nr:hypothetical protein [Algoriphagus sp. AK58]